jgi:hypothetical protein
MQTPEKFQSGESTDGRRPYSERQPFDKRLATAARIADGWRDRLGVVVTVAPGLALTLKKECYIAPQGLSVKRFIKKLLICSHEAPERVKVLCSSPSATSGEEGVPRDARLKDLLDAVAKACDRSGVAHDGMLYLVVAPDDGSACAFAPKWKFPVAVDTALD